MKPREDRCDNAGIIANNLELASHLGGTSLQFKGTDLVSSIDAFVKEYGVTHIVLGRSQRPRYRRWISQSVIDRLLQTIAGVDVVIVDTALSAEE